MSAILWLYNTLLYDSDISSIFSPENVYNFSNTAESAETTILCQEILDEINQDDSQELALLRGDERPDSVWDALRNVDNSEFCSIKFYKMQYARGGSKEFFPPGKNPVALRERSIRTFGECCWKVIR